MKIKCSELDFEIGSTGRIVAGTDLVTSANNIITKGSESISGSREVDKYIDAKEMKERVVSRGNEVGTKEGESGSDEAGGINVMKVYGNTIIQNDDPTGGITIASAGYLNLVAGQERVDLVVSLPRSPPRKLSPPSPPRSLPLTVTWTSLSVPGDVYFESEAGAYYAYAKGTAGSSTSRLRRLQARRQERQPCSYCRWNTDRLENVNIRPVDYNKRKTDY